jgi:hypothetical protein
MRGCLDWIAAKQGLVSVHMRFWSILKKCCGSQASRDVRLAVHARRFNVSAVYRHSVADYDYPACEGYNLPVIEDLFMSTLLAQRFPAGLWVEAGHPSISRGWCTNERAKLEEGRDFNGRNCNHLLRKAVAVNRRGKVDPQLQQRKMLLKCMREHADGEDARWRTYAMSSS